MKKINWFKRLFMSWKALESYFHASSDSRDIDKIESLYKELNEQKERTIKELKSQVELLNNQIIKTEHDANKAKADLDSQQNINSNLKNELASLKAEINSKREENKLISNEIRDQLKTIGKIERTFFASTGNKGKGELGEQQVKTILEKSGLPIDMWTTNLTVGKNTVEFAMQSGEEGKFIPIDSKVLDAELDDDGMVIINNAYKSKVKSAASDISKYLGKSNTADYGILVLQSDSIYMKLFEEYPTFFKDVIDEYKIQINSPSSFIQTAWQISRLINIYKRVKNDEKIYEDMISTLKSISEFGNKLFTVHKDFNIAMKHYGTIEKKHNNLTKRLDKEGKIKSIPSLENKDGE